MGRGLPVVTQHIGDRTQASTRAGGGHPVRDPNQITHSYESPRESNTYPRFLDPLEVGRVM